MNIKNKSSLLILVATLSCLAHLDIKAQSTRKAGIKGGFNFSNLYIDNITDQNARLGFNVGVFGQLFSSETFALQSELLFATKGSSAVYGGLINQEVSYNLNYLDVPVLAILKIGDFAEIHLGGYASYLLNANISYRGDLGDGAGEIDKDNLKSFDYGFSGGMAANFGKIIQAGARYNFGFVKIADSSAAKALIGDSKNSCTQIYVAFNLRAH
jgi:hypothetical protein